MILVKTEAGHRVLKDRSVRLTPRQRSAFILFDGKRSIGDVLASGMGIVREDIDRMVDLGLLGEAGETADAAHAGMVLVPRAADETSPTDARQEAAVRSFAPAAGTERSHQDRYKDAYPIAAQLTAGLGLRGFRLNLSVEGTSTYEGLLALAPRIRAAVGPEKAAALDRALSD